MKLSMLARKVFKPLPRKGTETSFQTRLPAPVQSSFQTTSPKGDGNACQTVDAPTPWVFKPLPRKGTETGAEFESCYRMLVFKPLPRKGTETLRTLSSFGAKHLFSNHFPERGRKRPFGGAAPQSTHSFQTTSPKGDGNQL